MLLSIVCVLTAAITTPLAHVPFARTKETLQNQGNRAARVAGRQGIRASGQRRHQITICPPAKTRAWLNRRLALVLFFLLPWWKKKRTLARLQPQVPRRASFTSTSHQPKPTRQIVSCWRTSSGRPIRVRFPRSKSSPSRFPC
ncbi:hypothetical protein EDB80DRAFT_393394 [Ilyonectria destructans]|nr:hypothetical protein EDB80DRAFT_393394 [Ilyonectria destructans]